MNLSELTFVLISVYGPFITFFLGAMMAAGFMISIFVCILLLLRKSVSNYLG